MRVRWEDGFEIRTAIDGDEVVLSANREGMLSLANIFRDLAEESPGAHIHLGECNSLEDGSCELVIVRAE